MKKIIELIISLALVAGLLAGCGGTSAGNGASTPPESTPPATQTETPETTGESNVEEAAWPRTIEDALGKQITLEKKPQRVATMDFGFIEIMYALGVEPIASTYAQRSLKGFGTLQPYAADAKVEELGEAKAPNLEKLAEIAPDLILQTAEAEHVDMELLETLSKVAPVVSFDSPDWKEQLRAFAQCLGEEEKAEAYISELEALIAASREKLAGYSDKTVALLFERSSNKGNFVITGSTENPVWFDKEKGLGLTPPSGYPEVGEIISLEGLATMNPDYLFLFGSITSEAEEYKQIHLSEETKASSVWQSLNAVKNGHVYTLDAAVRAGGPLSIKLGIETITGSMTR